MGSEDEGGECEFLSSPPDHPAAPSTATTIPSTSTAESTPSPPARTMSSSTTTSSLGTASFRSSTAHIVSTGVPGRTFSVSGVAAPSNRPSSHGTNPPLPAQGLLQDRLNSDQTSEGMTESHSTTSEQEFESALEAFRFQQLTTGTSASSSSSSLHPNQSNQQHHAPHRAKSPSVVVGFAEPTDVLVRHESVRSPSYRKGDERARRICTIPRKESECAVKFITPEDLLLCHEGARPNHLKAADEAFVWPDEATFLSPPPINSPVLLSSESPAFAEANPKPSIHNSPHPNRISPLASPKLNGPVLLTPNRSASLQPSPSPTSSAASGFNPLSWYGENASGNSDASPVRPRALTQPKVTLGLVTDDGIAVLGGCSGGSATTRIRKIRQSSSANNLLAPLTNPPFTVVGASPTPPSSKSPVPGPPQPPPPLGGPKILAPIPTPTSPLRSPPLKFTPQRFGFRSGSNASPPACNGLNPKNSLTETIKGLENSGDNLFPSSRTDSVLMTSERGGAETSRTARNSYQPLAPLSCLSPRSPLTVPPRLSLGLGASPAQPLASPTNAGAQIANCG